MPKLVSRQLVQMLCKAHDAITDLGYLLSSLSLALMLTIYCTEVIVRYLIGVANPWANDMFANFMVISVFAMLPHLTRNSYHISLTLLVELLPNSERTLDRFITIAGVLICGLVTWMSYQENVRQVAMGVRTMQNHPLPVIWWSIFITYGFGSSAIYFLRSGFRSDLTKPRSWVTAADLELGPE